MTVQQWIEQPSRFAEALAPIHDADGSTVARGQVGAICDYLPRENSEGGYIVVEFPDAGAVLCSPDEIGPA